MTSALAYTNENGYHLYKSSNPTENVMKTGFTIPALICTLAALSPSLWAGDAIYTLSIKDHHFTPAEITVPADTRVKLLVKNLDPSAEEFESYELNREKIVAGGKEAIIYVGPVKPGRYPFFGDFHQDSAKGVVIVK